MNIGILLCDEVREYLRAEHGDYGAMYSSWLNQSGEQFSYSYFNAKQEELPEDIHACDAYVISGSRHSVNEYMPWIANLEAFVCRLHAHKKN
jgi:GMP synthase-like glutamine amidotransferase